MIDQTLGHYRIVEQIGQGGMGVVYRAQDERLNRDVALKVLPASTLPDEAARKRFRTEALALSQLNHPNIATVHDFDTQDGVDFLVMEYVSGTTLAQRLAGGSLPEKEVAGLGVQIVAAMEEAHDRGIVHRDLKPSNIIVTPKGQAKVLDFGLAKLMRPANGGTLTTSLTQTEGIAGTLPYMAPEQLRGENADARTDLYAAGTVLYEMATGQRPFREELAARLTDAILHQVPVSPRALNARISAEMERIILKCLEKEPENRYQSAKEVGVDLRRLGSVASASAARAVAPVQGLRWSRAALASGAAAVMLLAALVVLNVGGWRERLLGRAAHAQIESLAVLPLTNFSRDPEQEYFADGMTEALITELAQISALRVISRTSVMRYKGTVKPLPEIARELHVDAVVEGSVARSGDHVRISAQLIEAATDRHLWAKSYERDLSDVLQMEGELARAVAREIQVKLTPQEQTRLTSARTVNPEAHDAYLKGRYYMNKTTEENVNKGIKYFQHAISIDRGYASAYAGLADAYYLLSNLRLPPQEAMPKARAAATKALELDQTLADAHTSLAVVKAFYDWQWPEAENEFRRALKLNPSYAPAHLWYGTLLSDLGRHDEALAEIQRALEIDPLSVNTSERLGETYYWRRQYDLAIEQYRKTLEMDPSFFPAHWGLGWAYEQKGMLKEAIAEDKETVRLGGGLGASALLGHAYAVAGKKSEAQQILRQLKSQSGKSFVSAYDLATIYVGLGEKERALTLLKDGYEQRAEGLVWLKVDPVFDSLRSDPRFQDLLRRVGLPP